MNHKKSHTKNGVKTGSGKQYQRRLLHAIVSLCVLFLNTQSASINAPAPIIHYNINMLEIGTINFLPSTNTLSDGNYQSSTTVTMTKMQQFAISTYEAHIGWRGINMIIMTQSQGVGIYGVGLNLKTTTSVLFECYITQIKFAFLTANYVLIHPDLVTAGIIYGLEFQSTTPCVGLDPVPTAGSSPCVYSFSTSMPRTGMNRVISVKKFSIFRDNDLSKLFYLDFAVRPLATSVNVQIHFGKGGSVNDFYISVIMLPNTHTDMTIKRSLQFEFFQQNDPENTVAVFTKTYPLVNSGFNDNFFIAVKILATSDTSSVYHFNVIADSSNKIVSTVYLVGSQSLFRAFVYFGYKCLTTAFHFSDATQQCEVCQDYCVSCQPNIYNKIQCLQCDIKFMVSFDKLSCICGMTQIASVCDNFLTLGLTDCTNAARNGTIVQCNFCTATKFQAVQNNQCGCKVGYNDLNNDGTCEQICGDGIFFYHKCDDGNTNSNDGCSSSCMLEQGFECDTNQPTFCSSEMSLHYKIGYVQRIEGQNKGRIKLNLMNSVASLPFDVFSNQFQPPTTYIRLFLITSSSPYKQTQLLTTTLIDFTISKDIILQFSYPFTAEALSARIAIDYGQTRYANHIQDLKWAIKGINSPLVYSDKLETYRAISIVLCVGTAFGILGLFVGVLSPKYIGLESLLTLQLIFYSQMLIKNPEQWPVGFLYLKYLKFASGYNEIFKLSEYVPSTVYANKLNHLDMKKTMIENFNINFVLLMLSFLVFIVIYTLKYIKQSQMVELEEKRKQLSVLDKEEIVIEFDSKESIAIMKSIKSFRYISEKAFWIVNHFCVWMLLPIMASIAAQIMIRGELVQIVNSSTFLDLLESFGPFIAMLTVFFIGVICMNNFMNVFLCAKTMKKILYKPEELIYKRLLLVYLLVIGSLVMFCNNVSIFSIPLSVVIFLLQLIYIIALIVIHPYKQSLRVHSITLLINQVVYLVFLFFINLINFVKDIDEILIIMLGYFITGCCGVLMVLTAVRLYYELKYGEALEKQIQKEREREEELQKQLEKEKLERKRKQLESDAKKKQTQKEIQRDRNVFLFQNQTKQDEAMSVIAWLDKCNWEAETKQKYFFSKFSQKPMDWLKKNNIEEYNRLREARKQESDTRRQKSIRKGSDVDYLNMTRVMKNEGEKHIEILQKKLMNHQKRIEQDMNYSMQMMKTQLDRFVSQDYSLVD